MAAGKHLDLLHKLSIYQFRVSALRNIV